MFSGGCGPPTATAIGGFFAGKYATNPGLATWSRFFAGEVAMLDITRGRWLPIQHPTLSADVHNDEDDDDNTYVYGYPDGVVPERAWEHRSGHVVVAAEHGLLVIGGIGYTGQFQDDVLHVGLF